MASLILASASPRRSDLLREAGISFTVGKSDIVEHDSESHPHFSPQELAQNNAMQKARDVARKFPEKFILAADTIVVCEDHIMGKPSSPQEAQEMLQRMSGKTHEVLTAVVFLCLQKQICREHIERSLVTFKKLDVKTIVAYMQAVDVMDKAGAYALQEHGEMIIERVEGSQTNVIGLPMEFVRKLLHENL